jgi:hypothetical protein
MYIIDYKTIEKCLTAFPRTVWRVADCVLCAHNRDRRVVKIATINPENPRAVVCREIHAQDLEGGAAGVDLVFGIDVEHIVGIDGNVCNRDISVVGANLDVARIDDVRLVGQEEFEVVEVKFVRLRQHNFRLGRHAVLVVIKSVGVKAEIGRRACRDVVERVPDIETQDATVGLQRVYLNETQLFRDNPRNHSVHQPEFLDNGIQFVLHRNPCRILDEVLTVLTAEFGVEVDEKMRFLDFYIFNVHLAVVEKINEIGLGKFGFADFDVKERMFVKSAQGVDD